MPQNQPAIEHPPAVRAPDGQLRRVGLEIAFGSLELEDAAARIVSMFGGELRMLENRHFVIDSGRLGTFEGRCDPPGADHLREAGATRYLTRAASSRLEELAGPVPPCEILCPAVPFEQLGEMDQLFDLLRRRGDTTGNGTVAVALGFDLVPDAPSLDASAVSATLKAYCLLCDRLRQDYAPDIFDEALVFPKRFPLDFRRTVVDPDYQPAMRELVTDYVAANPTRNRELDLLPLLACREPAKVRTALGGEMPEPRPVYCYRLPRAGLTRAGGRIVDEWNRWVGVERLAADPDRLNEMGRAFIGRGGTYVAADWADECARWLDT